MTEYNRQEAVQQQTTLTERLQYQKNTKFDKYSLNGVNLIQNSANNVSYQTLSSNSGGGQNFNFFTKIGKSLFLDRGIYLNSEIPIKISLVDASVALATKDNYPTALNNFQNICLSQYGLLQAIENIEVKFNDQTIAMQSNLATCFNNVSEYINEGSMSETFPASQYDLYQNYNHYDDSWPEGVSIIAPNGVRILTPKSKMSSENIFTGGFSANYNSRRPTLEFVSAALDKKSINFKLHLMTYIPFTAFGLPDDEHSYYGIDSLSINGTWKNDFVKNLFAVSQKFVSGTTFADFIDNIEFDYNNVNSHKTTLSYKIYTAPSYISDALIDRSTGKILPYRVGLNKVMLHPNAQTIIPQVDGTGSFTINDLNLTSVPKSIYLSIRKKKDTGRGYKTPNVMALINSLRIVYNTVETNITSSPYRIYNLAKSNGLQKNIDQCNLSGYVVKLDFNKDIGTGGLPIGMSNNGNCSIECSLRFIDPDISQHYTLEAVIVYAGNLNYVDEIFSISNSVILNTTQMDYRHQMKELYDTTPDFENMIGSGLFGDVWSGIKNLAKKGFNYAKENPEKILEFARKGIKLATGAGNGVTQPNYSNISGSGQPIGFSAGGGNVSTLKFKKGN